MIRATTLIGLLLISLTGPCYGRTALLRIVAAENVYGGIVQEIGGDQVVVNSILRDPNQDPHMFEASPSIAVALAKADLIVFNGADYDPWAQKLIEGSRGKDRKIINVARLVGAPAGANPHLWYDPNHILTFAETLTGELSALDKAHQATFTQNLARFRAKMRPLAAAIAKLKQRFHGVPVTATEPVFGYMAQALGLTMRNSAFQMAVMNDVEPSASSVAAFMTDLRQHKVAALIYNRQVTDSTTTHFLDVAKQAGVPVVGVSETEPSDQDYPTWMLSQLKALENALEQFH